MFKTEKSREFHSFGEDEFGYVDLDDDKNNGKYLSDAWGNPNIRIVVDHDGDGIIKLSDKDLGEITSALQIDYDSAVVDAAKDKLQVIRDKVGIFVLFDDTGGWDTENAFSWDIAKFLQKKTRVVSHFKPNPFQTRRRMGFTLMELLIVLAVMGVMMGMIGFSLSGGGGAALQASQRQLLGLVQQARAKAVLYGRPARLIVSVSEDEKDLDRFYRYLEIVVQDTNETGKWLIQGDGKFLEDGVFLVPSEDYSKIKVPDDWSELAYSVWSHEDDAGMKLKESLKGVREEGGTKVFSFLEFNGEGNLVCSHKSESSFPPYPN